MKYVYSVIRFVPDPVRGEFVNIGAIIGSDESSQWELQLVESLRRARRFDDEGILPAVWGFVNEIGTRIDSYVEAVEGDQDIEDDVSEDWLSCLWEESQNVVQLSAPAPMLAESIEEVSEIVFREFIVEPESRRHAFKKKYAALAAVRRSFREYQITKGHQFFERPTVRGPHHSKRFDFAVANGRAVQLTQTWSFQVPNQDQIAEDIKAWAWTVRDLRTQGGTAVAGDREMSIDREIDVEVVYVPPTSVAGRESLAEALSAFSEVNAKAVDVDNVLSVAQRAHDLLVSPSD